MFGLCAAEVHACEGQVMKEFSKHFRLYPEKEDTYLQKVLSYFRLTIHLKLIYYL